ncbi:MAG: aminopeptidase P family protein [Oscillospiraceae bacterium]|nr:aminopeptidase P family protein [Oscillospiraceae bacterium]
MTAAEKLRGLLPEGTAALIANPANRRYLSEFFCSDGAVLLTAEKGWFLTDFRYIEAARQTVNGLECVCYRKLSDTLNELLRGTAELLVESRHTVLDAFYRLEKRLECPLCADGRLDKWLSGLRAVKSESERDAILRAQALTQYGFDYILPRIAPGRSEREIALELEFAVRSAGADDVAFDIIAVGGPNSSLPHGVPGDRKLRRGDFLTLDFGVRLDGWHSDMTRTVAVGAADGEMRRVYDSVLEAQQRCLAGLRSGITGAEADALARDVIAAAGYGEQFGHSTGHGVGLEVHEEPRLSSANTDLLPTGAVVTVEPGIYLPGRFGVRIEDMVWLTADGCENLTDVPKELIVL